MAIFRFLLAGPIVAFSLWIHGRCQAQSPSVFSVAANYAIGPVPFEIALADVNGDGIDDLVTAQADPVATISVRLGLGGAAYGALASENTGAPATGLVVADLDGDGRWEILTTLAHQVVVSQWNDGLGAPAPVAGYATGLGASAVSAGDVNLDGFLDVVTTNGVSNTVTVWLGGPGGILLTRTDFPAGTSPKGLALVDANVNGSLDIAVCDATTQLLTLYNSGTGSFGAAVNAGSTFGSTDSLATGDINGDGLLDVLVVNASANGGANGRIDLHRASPLGLTWGLAIFCSFGVTRAIVFDVDGDGWRDVVCAVPNSHSVEITYSLGNGLFEGNTMGVVATVAGVNALAAKDYDFDGSVDLYITSGSTATATVLQNTIVKFYGPNPKLSGTPFTTGGSGGVWIAAGDVNGDGRPDAAVANYQSNDVSWFRGNGIGGLGLQPPVPVGVNPTVVVVADVNQDGDPDFVSLLTSGASIATNPGDGSGGFGPPIHYTAPSIDIGGDFLLTADFDSNGFPDFASTHGTAGLFVLLGDGTGDFTVSLLEYTPQFSFFHAEAAGDLNLDGAVDIVVRDLHAGNLLFLGTRSGTFAPAVPLALSSSLNQNLWIDDLNLDGKPDVLAGGSVIGFGDGSGGIGSTGTTGTGGSFKESVATGDVNGDGKPDVVVGDQQVYVSRGDGQGNFFQSLVIPLTLGAKARGMTLSDLDLDGRNEVLSLGNTDSVTVFFPDLPVVQGVFAFGFGTEGCAGRHGLTCNHSATLGSSDFEILATNAPPLTIGLGIAANAADTAGSGPFGLGITLYIDFLLSTELIALDFVSDASGAARVKAPIPDNPVLTGTVYTVQSIWIWPAAAACDPSPANLSASKGLSITVLP